MKLSIDWAEPVWGALMLALMFLAAYGGDWINALSFLVLQQADWYLTSENAKALPRKSYLVDPLPRLR